MTIDQAIALAVQHHQSGRLGEAEAIYRQVLGVTPNHPVALHNLGQMAYSVRRFDIAIDLLNKAIAAQPTDGNAFNTLGATLFAVGRVAESEQACRRSLQLVPDHSPAYANLGNALIGRGNAAGAIDAFEKAIALDPNNAIAHDGLGATLLMTGELQRGWREWEWRWLKPNYEPARFPHIPRWDGSDLAGKRILLMVEQGYGDVFQFARYAPLLKARGATVLLEVVPDMHRFMSSLNGVDQLVIAGLNQPRVDLVCPLLSVPLWYGTTLQSIPAEVPYLTADARLTESFNAKYFRADPNLKVGLVWAGRPTHSNDHNRTLSLAALAPLADVSGVTYYTLQKGEAAKQLRQPPPGMKIIDLSVGLTDFSWTAAAIAGLDLILTVDTSIAHVGGALAKPVWVMIPYVPDWRWMLDREDTPWYPTLRLFRQKNISDWTDAVIRIREQLQSAATRHRQHPEH